MHIKSARFSLIASIVCTSLFLAGCAAEKKEKSFTSFPPESKTTAAAPVVPFTPTPEPFPTPPPPPPAPAPAAPAPVASFADLPPTIVAWDAMDKAVTVNAGEAMAKFEFAFTNISAAPVTIVAVTPSCSCTAVQLPPMPWKIDAGSSSNIHVNVNLAGKSGTVIKTVAFATDKGTKHLLVRTTIQPAPANVAMAPGMREQNQQLALSDRQAVFRGDCARCHADVAKGKQGKELYLAACGVCHEAEHRATMVADLHIPKQERNEEYWRNWITNGKQGSLMPAFAISEGGILDEAQVASLVDYLMKNMPTKPGQTTTPAAH